MVCVWHAWYTGGISYTHFSFKRFKLIILWSSIAQNVFNSSCFFPHFISSARFVSASNVCNSKLQLEKL